MSKQPLRLLADELEVLTGRYFGRKILHVESGTHYRITSVSFREADVVPVVEYTPLGEYFNQVKFSRTQEEMGFGTRFVIVEG